MSNLCNRPIYQKGMKPAKSPRNREGARDKPCTLAIPGVCRSDPAYTVGCHVRLFNVAGASQKPDDLFLIDGCDKCHAVFDSRDKWAASGLGYDDVLRALMVSQQRRRASGAILLADEQ